MGFRKVDAGSGINWLSASVSLVLGNPVVFLLMGLILAVINIVPVLGSLVLAILGPALLGGIVFAAREQAVGRPTDIAQLFRAFQEPGKIGPMLLLCLPGIAGGFVLLTLVLVFGLSALIGGGLTAAASGSDAHLLETLGSGLLVFALLALIVGLVIYALQFFAIPRVMLDNVEPFAAMRESFSACLANAGAFILFCVVLLVAFLVLGVVLAFIPLLGWLALMMAGWAVVGCAMYLAYRQVYDDAATAQALPPTPEPPVT